MNEHSKNSNNPKPENSRRDFLTGRALKSELEHAGNKIANKLAEENAELIAGDFGRLETRAMACQFAIMFNPGSPDQIWNYSETLDEVHPLEQQLTIYNDDSELQKLNHSAFLKPFKPNQNLYKLLKEACTISRETNGAYNPVAGPLVQLWKSCRDQNRIPTNEELEKILPLCDIENVLFNDEESTIAFSKKGTLFNLGGIGKGYALDVLASKLKDQSLNDWLLHGGQSSILAKGMHGQLAGWPVGIKNPLFPQRTLRHRCAQKRRLLCKWVGRPIFSARREKIWTHPRPQNGAGR